MVKKKLKNRPINQMDLNWADDVEENSLYEGAKSSDPMSNDDGEKSSSYCSDSVHSSRLTRYSYQRSKPNGLASRSVHHSKFSYAEKVPCAESECNLLNLLDSLEYPMTQVNGQRKLGPPPGWSKSAPGPNCEIFVGKLPRDVYEDEIYPVFSAIGMIYELRLMMDFSGTNRGYCFIMYTKPEDAERAIKELDNYEISEGRRIGVVASINNCRLCINPLPPRINSKIVIEKFYKVTDGVSGVTVYKKPNGNLRYALVSYKTHRGAAMARRRLLPERAKLFQHAEVNIDWANPSMLPNNVIEESGVRDNSGNLKFSNSSIGAQKKRGGSQKQGTGGFSDKNAIYRDPSEKTGGKNIESQGRNLFWDRQRGRRADSNQRGSVNNDEVRGRELNKENLNVNNKECTEKPLNPLSSLPPNETATQTSKPNSHWYRDNRDINGNFVIAKNSLEISQKVDAPGKSDEIISQGQELASLARNIVVPQYPPLFNFFGQYSIASNINNLQALSVLPTNSPYSPYSTSGPTAILWHRPIPNFVQHHDNRMLEEEQRKLIPEILHGPCVLENAPKPQFQQKYANFAEFCRWNPTESFVRIPTLVQTNYPLKNDRNQRKQNEDANTSCRVRNYLPNLWAPNQMANWNGNYHGAVQENRQIGNLSMNQMGSVLKENNNYLSSSLPSSSSSNICQVCANQAAAFRQEIRHFGGISGLPEFNDFKSLRGFNGFSDNPICLVDRVLVKQETRSNSTSGQSQSAHHPTSRFSNYPGLLEKNQTQINRGNAQSNPRAILSRLSLLKLDEF